MESQPPSQSPFESSPPVAAAIAEGLPPAKGRPGLRIWLVLIVIFLALGLMISLMVNLVLFTVLGISAAETDRKVEEKFYSHDKYASDKVAIISVTGTILDGQGFVKDQIDRAKNDPDVKAVVLRVNSPGGTVSGSDEIYHQLRELAEREDSPVPIVVSMGSLAASGGYYVAMACGDTPDAIFAEPSTWTGSIGVMIPYYNFSGLMKEWGVEQDSIVSHPLKGMGNPFGKPLTEQERRIFQELVDESFNQFKDIIKQGRPKFKKDPAALDKLATGQIYTAGQAKDNGLIDRIGFLEKAVDRAIEVANLDKDNVTVVRYKPIPTLADILMGAEVKKPSFDLAALLDMAAPRAYYLSTWLPGLAQRP